MKPTTTIGMAKGSRFSGVYILLWLCLLIQFLEGGLSASRAGPFDVDQPRVNTSESAQSLTLTPKSKGTPHLFAILKQYHDQLLRTIRYKDYELQQIFIMSPSVEISLAEMNQFVTMGFVKFASSRGITVEVTFEGGRVTSARVPNDEGPDRSSLQVDFELDYLRFERGGHRALLKAHYMPLNLPSAFWKMELADFVGTLSDSSGRLVPDFYHGNQGIEHRDPDVPTQLYIRREPRAFLNLQWRVSDPTPCTFRFKTTKYNSITGALSMGNERMYLTDIALFHSSSESPVRHWPLWLRKRQGPTPAWYGEVEDCSGTIYD